MCYSTIKDSCRVIFFGLSCLVLATDAAQNKGPAVAIKENRQLGGIDRREILHPRMDHAVNKTEALLQDYYQRKDRIEKRYLNWKSNQIISTSTKENPVIVHFFKPHAKSERVNINEDYLGFTLYKRNGKEVGANTGIFHFVRSSDSEEEGKQCRRRTLHAGAYRYIYGNCPEDDFDLVASGYCHRKGGYLVYNSGTFNGVLGYADDSYYANDDRMMNNIEITYFAKCFNDWKDAGFDLTEFQCQVSRSLRVYQPNGTVYHQAVSNSSIATCKDCEQLCNSSIRLIVSSSVIFIFGVFQVLVSTF